MRRREFFSALGGAVAWPFAVYAQQSREVPRIGMLWVNSAEGEKKLGFTSALRAGLRELGYVEGQNLIVEERFGNGNAERLENQAAELVKLGLGLIVSGGDGTYAAARATKTIPIVTTASADLIATGLAESLAHPGGNVTGITIFTAQLAAKRVELLKQILPSLGRAALLLMPGAATNDVTLRVVSDAARALSVQIEPLEASDVERYESAFAKAASEGAGGLVIADAAKFFGDAPILATLANRYHLAAVGAPVFAAQGLLCGHGVDFHELFHHAAIFVDKILKGEKAGEIPLDQATRFRTVVNLKSAKALGLEVPPNVLAAADEVIE